MILLSKRITAMLLALLCLLISIPIMLVTVEAAEVITDIMKKANVSWGNFLDDEEKHVFTAYYGLRAEDNPFGNAVTAGRHRMTDYTAKRDGLTGSSSDWVYGEDYVYCFCIEHGIALPGHEDYSGSSDPTHGNKYELLSDSQKELLYLALAYGYTNRTGIATAKQANACYAATQLIIWQITLGFRTSPTELDDKTYPASGYTGTMTEQYTSNPYLKEYYDLILSDMANHFVRPSFTTNVSATAPIYQMDYVDGKYTVTLTDINNVLSKYKVTVNSGVTAVISGNQLILTSSRPITDEVTIKLNRSMPKTNHTTGFLIWSVEGKEEENQDMVSGVPTNNDPVPSYLKVQTTDGSIKIVKTAEDGKVDDVNFRIQGDGVDTTVTTENGGQIQVDNLRPGVYTVTEQTQDLYTPQESRTVTVVTGQTATVTFSNTLKRGSLTVTKTAEDGLTEGVQFHLYGTSLSGLTVDEYATVGSDGKAYFKDVLIGNNYVLEEIGCEKRYILPEAQNVTILWNEMVNRSFDNRLKKWQLTVTKIDSETGETQGDASLEGAVYGIYKDNVLIDRYVTDAMGQFTTEWYLCGDNWMLQELTPSEGYLLDTAVYKIGAEAGNFTVEYNPLSIGVKESIIKGKISIVKHADDGKTQVETPEVGAAFEVYLKSTGSYDNAKNSERDLLVCDENGMAETKPLPYGIYIVRQISGWEGHDMMEPFDAFIDNDGEVYRFIMNDEQFRSYLKIVKTDTETGKVIPYAGAGFQIYDPEGNLVTMTITYPEVKVVNIFYTSESGYLLTPERLDYGKHYSIVEVQAPYGYTLNSEPSNFDITKENSTTENGVTVISVTYSNLPQKGQISVSKTGETFSSVVYDNGIYRPVYEIKGLAGAVYEIRPAEDIYTPDGTIRYKQGELVDTATTGIDGKIFSKELYLGKYEVQEIQAPYGMLLNSEIHTVELAYEGQEIEITEVGTSFYNERQKISISLKKFMERDDRFGIGNKNDILSVRFGLYAAEDLIAADGTFIPKDGLIEAMSCDANGCAIFSADIPVGAKLYVKEMSTDEHYVLSDTKYPVVFEYAGQDTALVEIQANDGNTIENKIIRGKIPGRKIDRETGEAVVGALFGLFRADETEFTEDRAILTTASDENGFTFDGVPYGEWIIVELSPAEGYLPNNEIYPVTVDENGQSIEVTVMNDLIPEIGTTATSEGEKETHPHETITIEDVVEYKHLIPGKEYTVKGVLMDKTTGVPSLANGQEVTSEVIFVPETPSGKVVVTFIFDGSSITENTDILVFERLYKDGVELAAHEDIDNEDQTVSVLVPEIGTTASVNGEKKVNATDIFTLEDIVHYENLIPGKEYILTGVLMDKNTGAPLLLNGEEIRSEVTFIPETASGDVIVSLVFDSKYITAETALVVFEKLLDADSMTELANHEDMKSQEQTITVHVPQIGTQAMVDGEKEANVDGEIIIEDVVTYTNLTPGKEYTLKGLLMNKATDEAFTVNGREIHSEATFTPETPDGKITVYFAFDTSGLTATTELTVLEWLYYDEVEMVCHTDIESVDQMVKLIPPTPPATDIPQTGDNSHLWLWVTLAVSSLGGIIFMTVKDRKLSKVM